VEGAGVEVSEHCGTLAVVLVVISGLGTAGGELSVWSACRGERRMASACSGVALGGNLRMAARGWPARWLRGT
jgi:hypothetical protein